MRIAVVGGGPGGLFFAALIRQADPSVEVTVFERNRADDTFGFGVVFSDATLAGIHDADPVLREALADARRALGRHRGAAQGRADPVRRQRDGRHRPQDPARAAAGPRAEEVGVELRFCHRGRPRPTLADYDLVVAADGANSAIRDRLGRRARADGGDRDREVHLVRHRLPLRRADLRARARPARRLRRARLPDRRRASARSSSRPTRSPGGGPASTSSTSPSRPGPSDEKTKAYLEKLFAEQIDGHQLLVNNSRWGNFRTRRTAALARSSRGHVVLLGDAAHTAHFSVGSGTKMAMEDAVALAAGARRAPRTTSPAPWPRTRRRRQPSVDEDPGLGAARACPGGSTSGATTTRSSRGSSPSTSSPAASPTPGWRAATPAFVAATHRAWVQRTGPSRWTPRCGSGGTTFPGRLLADLPAGAIRVEAPADEAGLPAARARVRQVVEDGAELVAVHGGVAFTRTLVCEEVRLAHGRRAALVDATLDADAALTAVLSGRADLVVSG